MSSHALTAARRNLDYARASDREIRRLRKDNESLESQLMAAKTAAAHLRDENKALRAQLDDERAISDTFEQAATGLAVEAML